MRHLVLHLSLLLLGINFPATQASAQSERELAFIRNMESTLELSENQSKNVWAIYHDAALELDSLQGVIKTIEQSAIPEEQVRLQVLVMNQEKKDIKAIRDSEVESLLTEEQREKYLAEIKPVKPSVLHFGIHNRADCNVCNK